MKHAEIREQDQSLFNLQHEFRLAADTITDAWMTFPFVSTIALIGSIARPLWKEVPRFREYRQHGIEVWHECHDLDLAIWLDSFDNLDDLRRVQTSALRKLYEAGITKCGIVSHQVDTFLFKSGSQHYVGRLCYFNRCPKGKRECFVPGCGTIPFNKQVEGFVPYDDLLAEAVTLYKRGTGRISLAAALPQPIS